MHHNINHDYISPITELHLLITKINILNIDHNSPQTNNQHIPPTLQLQRLFHLLQQQQGFGPKPRYSNFTYFLPNYILLLHHLYNRLQSLHS